MWGEILSALGEGGKGALDAYTWHQDYKQRDRQIDNRAEIARIQAEVRELIAEKNAGVKRELHETPSGSVLAQQEGATARNDADNATRVELHGTPSGSVLAQQEGATARNLANLSLRERLAQLVEGGRNRRFDEGITARGVWNARDNATRERGQDLGFDAATMRDTTTQRGQDLGAAAAAATNATRQRGQALRSGASGTGLPPVGGAAPDPSGATPDRAQLAAALRAAIAAVQNAKTPAERDSARKALAALRAQVQ